MSSAVNATAASILGLLDRGPLSGWELYAGFTRTIGHFWSISRSQIYRELRTLEAAGFIEVGATGKRDRRVCTITAAGRAVFRAWITRLPGDELIRFPLLLTIFFGAAVAPETLAAACAEQRSKHAARLIDYESMLPAAAAHDVFAEQALRFGIGYERTVLAWIDALPWAPRAPR